MNDHTELVLRNNRVLPFSPPKPGSFQHKFSAASALIVAPVGESRQRLARLVNGESLHLDPEYLEAVEAHLAAHNGGNTHQLAIVDFYVDRLRAMTEFVRGLHRDYPSMVIVAITGDCDETLIDTAIHAGATSVMLDEYTDEQIISLLTLATNGVGHRPVLSSSRQSSIAVTEKLINPFITTSFEKSCASRDSLSKLSEKQLEVLSLMSDGLTNSQIGERLHVKVGTVKTHVTQILRRLCVDRRAEAILKAQRMREVREQQVAFARTGDGLLSLLLPHVTYARHHKGEVIFCMGDQAQHLYYIKRGTVRMVEIEKTCGPGEIFGEIGMFVAGGLRTSTAVCETDVELFFMTEDQVQEMLYSNPQFAIHVAATMASRLLADRATRESHSSASP